MIKFFPIILAIFSLNFSWAFTLNNNMKLAFAQNNVAIHWARGLCTNLNMSDDELLSLIDDAVIYWNKSPTSRLKLTKGDLLSVSGNYATDLLCLTGTNCDANPNLSVDHEILISCNTNNNNFHTPSNLATTLPNHYSGNTIIGSLILINDISNNLFKNFNRDEKVAVIAHEIGHAIGLGHSPVQDSLMYYSLIPNRRSLGQDDIDGITYLYPKSQPLSCGTITEVTKKGPPNEMLLGLFIGIFLSFLFTRIQMINIRIK